MLKGVVGLRRDREDPAHSAEVTIEGHSEAAQQSAWNASGFVENQDEGVREMPMNVRIAANY